MATGKQMLQAVRAALKRAPENTELKLTVFDCYDLFKLSPIELAEELGIEQARAESIGADLQTESLEQLSLALGARLVQDKKAKNLIPGEGIRRSAGILADPDDDSEFDPDAIVEEIRRMRYPEAQQ